MLNKIFDKLNISEPELICFIQENLLNLKKLKDEYYILWFKDDKLMFQLCLKSNNIDVDYFLIWDVFEKKFNYTFIETKELIKNIIKEHYKIDDTNPCATYWIYKTDEYKYWCNK